MRRAFLLLGVGILFTTLLGCQSMHYDNSAQLPPAGASGIEGEPGIPGVPADIADVEPQPIVEAEEVVEYEQQATCRCRHCMTRAGHQLGMDSMGPGGPATAAVTYPYYTLRGPRDFFLDDPPRLGD